MIDFSLPPPEATFNFEKMMKDWQASYEKTAARLTAKLTWKEMLAGEFCGWLLAFKVPQILAALAPIFDRLYAVIRDYFRAVREHYRFKKMSPAEQEKHLENMKPSMWKLIAVGATLTMPFVLGFGRKR